MILEMIEKMQIPVIAYILSVVIATLALSVSLTTLFKSHLSKFKPIITVGDLNVRIYPIKSENKEWFIPSFYLPISISNDGAKPGKILGVRLCISYPDLPIPNNKEILLPIWEIDNFRNITKNRFDWIEEACTSDWMPFVILPKNTVNKNIVLETRWDDPVIQNNVDLTLEIYTESEREWIKVNNWKFVLIPFVWDDLTSGSSYTIKPEYHLPTEERVYPKDLHKYTGSKEPITKSDKMEPSYLNYKD